MRVPTGEVTVVLGAGLVRRRVMALLDDAGGRGPGGGAACVRRVGAGPDEPVAARVIALARARDADLVLVDRITDGLDARGRREVLDAVRRVAAGGAAVLVDDVDPVAALSVADVTLRIDPQGAPVLAPVAAERLADDRAS